MAVERLKTVLNAVFVLISSPPCHENKNNKQIINKFNRISLVTDFIVQIYMINGDGL